MSDEIKIDQSSRKMIREELDTNLFVEAGAGSGKTTELVTRMVNMVKDGKEIDKICAITFTKNAANEFYRRFKEEIEKAAKEGNENCAKALRLIDLCFMGTIDSFCQMILQEHPTEAGIPSDAVVAEDGTMEAFYLRVYSEIQGGKYGDDIKNLCARFRNLCRKPEKTYLELVSVLMNKSNTEIVYDQPGTGLDPLFADEKKVLCNVFEVLTAHPEFIFVGMRGGEPVKKHTAAKDAILDGGFVLTGDWDDTASQLLPLLKSLSDLHLNPTVDLSVFGKDAPFVLHEGKGNYYDLAQEYHSGIAAKIQEQKYNTALSLADKAVKLMKENLKKEGKLTFFDYEYCLKEMLKKDASVADVKKRGKLIRHIYERHSYFLLDEFQDTDPMQAEIFFYLAAKDLNPDWKQCVPHEGALFIVGDPKQSIYRFRNADVSAYNTVKSLFTGKVGRQVKLTCNFRSTLTMCNWFNQVFPTLFPAKEEAEQSVYEIIPVDERTDIPGTFGGVFEYRTEAKEESPEAVLGIIRKLVGNGEYLIQEKEDPAPRPITYRDIMVITTNKKVLGDYIGTFEEHHIPYMVEGTAEFKNCPALAALANIYSAVAAPGDRTSLYRALTGSVFGVGNSDLLKETYANGFPSAYADPASIAEEGIRSAIVCINDLIRKSKTNTPAGLFTLILDECGIFRTVGYENAEYAYYALELLRTREAGGEISTVKEGAAFLDQLLAGDSGLERILSLTQKQDRVHIANLHKVKGLEAPIVILTASNYSPGVSVRTDLSTEPAKTWILELKEKTGNYQVLLSAPGFTAEKEKEAYSQSMERVRLLYVAATRARRALLIGAQYNDKNERGTKNYWLPLLSDTMSQFDYSLQEQDICGEAGEISSEELQEKETSVIREASESLAKSFEIHLPSKEKLKSGITPEDQPEDAPEEPAETRPEEAAEKTETAQPAETSAAETAGAVNAAVLGTLVHRLMEILVTSGNSVKLEEAVKDILSEYDADSSKYEAILLSVGTTIRSGGYEQENGMPKDILTELLTADEVHCEYPFCYKAVGKPELWNGVMDVVYRKGETWHIVDYKTNEQRTNLDDVYRSQLDAYVEAFRISEGLEADARIYHIAAK